VKEWLVRAQQMIKEFSEGLVEKCSKKKDFEELVNLISNHQMQATSEYQHLR
jgi:hypothetical protein